MKTYKPEKLLNMYGGKRSGKFTKGAFGKAKINRVAKAIEVTKENLNGPGGTDI